MTTQEKALAALDKAQEGLSEFKALIDSGEIKSTFMVKEGFIGAESSIQYLRGFTEHKIQDA